MDVQGGRKVREGGGGFLCLLSLPGSQSVNHHRLRGSNGTVHCRAGSARHTEHRVPAEMAGMGCEGVGGRRGWRGVGGINEKQPALECFR